MNGYLSILSALLAAGVAGVWFMRNERARKPERTVLFFLVFLIVEAALYESQSRIPAGLIHPGLGADPNPGDDLIETSFSFRLLDILIPPCSLGAPAQPVVNRGGAALPTFAWVGFLRLAGTCRCSRGSALGEPAEICCSSRARRSSMSPYSSWCSVPI